MIRANIPAPSSNFFFQGFILSPLKVREATQSRLLKYDSESSDSNPEQCEGRILARQIKNLRDFPPSTAPRNDRLQESFNNLLNWASLLSCLARCRITPSFCWICPLSIPSSNRRAEQLSQP